MIFAGNPLLLALALNVANIAGSTTPIDAHATTGNGWGHSLLNGNPVDLHSIILLTALLQSKELLTASQNTPELLQKILLPTRTSLRNHLPVISSIYSSNAKLSEKSLLKPLLATYNA